jgi:hypothetical protein
MTVTLTEGSSRVSQYASAEPMTPPPITTIGLLIQTHIQTEAGTFAPTRAQ